jgi:hypothetical protein
MDRSETPGPGEAAPAAGESGEATHAPARVLLEAVDFRSGHGILKACGEDVGWKNAGDPCPSPAWTPARSSPVSHTLGEPVHLELTLGKPDRAERATIDVHGEGPDGLRLAPADGERARGDKLSVVSTSPLGRRIAKVSFGVRWSDGRGGGVSPSHTHDIVYTTFGRPMDDRQADWQEDGVTLKRMDRAVSWVAPLRTLGPHAIVRALMRKFPFYALHPSPKVPRKYHHPTYFNDEGGAWPMSDYVDESGECQAIVRLVRGVLRQLGVPGEARVVVVWGDPEVDGGKKALSAYLDENPNAGLDRTKIVNGRTWLATLVDGPVEAGKLYPPSHTPQRGGPSPGFNRYEACLEFTHGGETRDYGGGAGEFASRDEVLHAFWGLVWVSEGPRHGFRVEEIVAKY